MKLRNHQPTIASKPTTTTIKKTSKPKKVLTFNNVFNHNTGNLIILLILFGALTLNSNKFLTNNNLTNLTHQVTMFKIIAINQLLIILTTGINLSINSILNLTNCVTTKLLIHN